MIGHFAPLAKHGGRHLVRPTAASLPLVSEMVSRSPRNRQPSSQPPPSHLASLSRPKHQRVATTAKQRIAQKLFYSKVDQAVHASY